MLLPISLSNFMCLLLPALTFAHVINQENPVDLAAHHKRLLSTPLKNLLHRREALLFASTPNVPGGLALNSTNGQVEETIPFEAEIDIIGRSLYFIVKGEIDEDYSCTVEVWVHCLFDRRIGVFNADLTKGIDMKIPDSIKVINGEARLYVVESGEYDILIFEAYGTAHVPYGPTKKFGPLQKEIKRWRVGSLPSIEDVPNNSGVQTLSNDTGVDTSLSIE